MIEDNLEQVEDFPAHKVFIAQHSDGCNRERGKADNLHCAKINGGFGSAPVCQFSVHAGIWVAQEVKNRGGHGQRTIKPGVNKGQGFLLPTSHLDADSKKGIDGAGYLERLSHLPKVRLPTRARTKLPLPKVSIACLSTSPERLPRMV
jgi:hypothetical protein